MITTEVKNPILKDIITRKTAVSGKVYTDIGGATYIGNDEGGLSVIQTIGGEVIGDLKNSQVNKIGPFTREQILTGLAPVLDASKTVKGISKLSVAPDVKTNPIAVGDNDPRNSDARTPLAHASTHDAGGNDPITIPVALITSIEDTLSVDLTVTGGKLTATVITKWFSSKYHIETGESVTVPAKYQQIISEELINDGEIEVLGELVLIN